MMHVYGAMTVVIFIHSKEFGDDEGVEGDDGGDGIQDSAMFGDEFGDEFGDKFGDHQIWR